MTPNPTKRALFWALLLLLVVSSIELLALAAFHIVEPRQLFSNPEFHTLPNDQLLGATGQFDARLGWDWMAHTPYGERKQAVHYERILISTFGDSFTFGEEVEDDETWQTALAEKLHSGVLNFGVHAYGLDQALLKAERLLPIVKTPIAILAFIDDDLLRNMYSYRGFRDRGGLTKPRFTIKDDALVLIDNPIVYSNDLVRLTDPQYIKSLWQLESWRAETPWTKWAFPYSKALLSAYLAPRRPDSDLNDWLQRDSDAPPRRPVRAESVPMAIGEEILARFSRFATARGAHPIVLFLPGPDNLNRTGLLARDLKRRCTKRELTCLFPQSSFAKHSVQETFTSDRLGAHYNARGNQIVADVVFRYLEQEGLVPPKP